MGWSCCELLECLHGKLWEHRWSQDFSAMSVSSSPLLERLAPVGLKLREVFKSISCEDGDELSSESGCFCRRLRYYSKIRLGLCSDALFWVDGVLGQSFIGLTVVQCF